MWTFLDRFRSLTTGYVLTSPDMILRFLLLLSLFSPVIAQKPAPLLPGQVAVVYNKLVPASRELAEFYALNRRIPDQNVIGLEVPERSTIDRATYDKTIRTPLRQKFIENKWWTMGKDPKGVTLPTETSIRCLVVIKGMPLRISGIPLEKGEDPNKREINDREEAAVDSELSLMGVTPYPLGGPQNNPYFKKEFPASTSPLNYLLLVGRIDAHTYDHCKRMVLDGLETEEKGLWGRTYLDFANKTGNYAMGDQWIEGIVGLSRKMGHPTIVDRMNNTFVTNYPMQEAAVYFGWYTTNRNGPFLNSEMKFQKGAIAVHLHSFSAQQLNNPAKNWSAALIDRGAAATLGNTWEPYLQASHHFDVFYDRLTKGFSLVEASYMSMNAISWQNIVLGDPLYTPYKLTTVTSETLQGDRQYKLIRYAQTRFPDSEQRTKELIKAAQNTKNGTIFEMMAFDLLEEDQPDRARNAFLRAREAFTEPVDRLRQDLNIVELERRRKNDAAALTILNQAKTTYADLPESKAVDGLLTILNPPSPPATKK